MSDETPEMFWRGKRISELTHHECLSALLQMSGRIRELEALPVDWRQHARDKASAPAKLGSYVGKAVYDGKRVLTPDEVARLKRAHGSAE